MRKITQSLGEHLKPVRLFLDDIEQIVEILHQASPEVSISSNHYAFDDFKQLADLKQEVLTDIRISIRQPYVSLSLEEHQIWLYAATDDAVSKGIFESVKQLLLTRRRPVSQILQSPLITGILGGLFFPVVSIGLATSNSLVIISSVLILIGSVASAWYGYQERFKKYSIIVPKYRIEAPSFWKRNSDAVLLAVFSAMIGGVITLILAKVFGIIP